MIKLNSQIKGTEKSASQELPLQAHWTWDRTHVAAERWWWLRVTHTKCLRNRGICLAEQIGDGHTRPPPGRAPWLPPQLHSALSRDTNPIAGGL